MNMDRIEGHWRQLKGSFKQQWGKLVDDPFIKMEGRRDCTTGINQVSFGIARDRAARRMTGWQAQKDGK
jgi:uncharacterized protein YjbJ (UPF0337 family)